MNENTSTAGWFDNPEDDKTLRYYDGEQWTEHTSPKPEEPQEPSKRPSGKRWVIPVCVGAAAFLFGSVAGVYGAGGPPEVKTVTKEVEVPVEKIVEKPVEKEVVKEKKVKEIPESCLSALDLADTKISELGEGMLIASDIFSALENYNLTAMESSVAELDHLANSFSLDDYTEKASQCRSEK